MIIRHESEMAVQVRTEVFGGCGSMTVRSMLNPDEMAPAGRMFNHFVIPPGASIGQHEHVGDTEFYLITAGEGTYYADGEEIAVKAGDITRVDPGHTHGLVNTSNADLEMIALILFLGTDAGESTH